ncbi:MAG: hypothetical protein ACFFKA_16630, partial [Candidatus Thorarchaeota archaeon]
MIINAGFIFEINLITYPLAQTVAYITYFFTRAFFNYYIIVIEIIVIIIEFLLVKRKIYRLVKFHYINDSKQIKQIKSKKKILLSVAIANIITFLLGIWISFPWIQPMRWKNMKPYQTGGPVCLPWQSPGLVRGRWS